MDPTTPASPAWQPNATIGRYTLMVRIAIGGMAEIWLARETGLKGFERVVVVKRISDALSQDAAFVEMFLDEARIAAQLSHPNIVQIYELGEQAGAYYIAMEYLPGEDLANIVRATRAANLPMPFSYTARIIADAAAGLASAHSRLGLDGKPLNVVHRDVSPQNLIVTYEGGVKVVDFGIAKAANRASTTEGGQLKGKFSYMSPEQILGEAVDGRSDVWSLGVVLFEAITGTRLFAFKDDYLKTLRVITGDQPIPLAHTRNEAIPPALDAIVAKALERNRDHRYATAHAFQAALEGWLKAQPDAPVGNDLATFMDKLFAERKAKRLEVIESVRKGEVQPPGTPVGLKPPTERSMPGLSTPARAKKPKPVLPFVGGGALLAVLAIAGVLMTRGPKVGGLDLDTEPGGAQIVVDGNTVGVSPVSVEDLKAGDHVVVATLGTQEVKRQVKISAGGRTNVHLAFEKKAEPVPVPPPAPVVPPPAVADAGVAVAKPPPPVAAAGKGTLTLETSPWTQVFENGKLLGETPLIQIPMSAGRHKLDLKNPDKGIKKSIEVQIAPNKTTTKRLTF